MIKKYYTFNVIDENGAYVGSKVIGLLFWHSPVSAMRFAVSTISKGRSITDFKRIY